MDQIKPKIANIRLKAGQEPITVSGLGFTGNNKESLKYPTLKRQTCGWYSREAKRIVTEHPDRYEILTDGKPVGGCCK